MRINVYALRDLIAEYYLNPIYANTDAACIRSVEQAVKQGQGPLGENPEHFHLFKIGHYNTDTGAIVPQVPDLVAQCGNMKPATLAEPFDVTNVEP